MDDLDKNWDIFEGQFPSNIDRENFMVVSR